MAGVDFNTMTFKVFYVCTALLSLKVLAMALLTARQRFKKKVVITPEDKPLIKGSQVNYNNNDVERVRRAHRNDLENIPVFITCGSFYAMTGPNPVIAVPLLIVYTVARFFHTYVYAVKVTPQPARFLAFAIGYIVNLFMAGSIIHHTGLV